MTPRARRRAIGAFAVLAVLLCAALLWLRHTDRAPASMARTPPRLPTMGRGPRTEASRAPEATRAVDAFATVLCTLRGDPDAPPASGTLRAIEVESGDQHAASANGSDLVLTVPEGRWTLRWDPDGLPTGYRLGTVDLVEGDVFRCALSATGVEARGRVIDPDGNPVERASTQGCGPSVWSGADGTFRLTVPFQALRGPDGTCALRARWTDGMLSRYSEPATVSVLEPGPHTLTVDPSPVAGMGITLRQDADGLLVGYVHPDTPAEEADLRVGDRLLSVDGHDTEGMSTLDFIPYGVGAEGSTVVLEIERDGQERRVSFRRERIERTDQSP